jgi:hypothetical protein
MTESGLKRHFVLDRGLLNKFCPVSIQLHVSQIRTNFLGSELRQAVLIYVNDFTTVLLSGQGSLVSIVTDYGLDRPGIESSGFGGLVVSMLPSGTQDRRFAPDRSRRIFPAGKIHSVPSFGGEVK